MLKLFGKHKDRKEQAAQLKDGPLPRVAVVSLGAALFPRRASRDGPSFLDERQRAPPDARREIQRRRRPRGSARSRAPCRGRRARPSSWTRGRTPRATRPSRCPTPSATSRRSWRRCSRTRPPSSAAWTAGPTKTHGCYTTVYFLPPRFVGSCLRGPCLPPGSFFLFKAGPSKMTPGICVHREDSASAADLAQNWTRRKRHVS